MALYFPLLLEARTHALEEVITPLTPAGSAAHKDWWLLNSFARGLWVAFVWEGVSSGYTFLIRLSLMEHHYQFTLFEHLGCLRALFLSLRSLQTLVSFLLHTRTLSFRTLSLKCIDFVLPLIEFPEKQWRRLTFALGNLLGRAFQTNPDGEYRWQN